ncbi:hypothetical protein EWH12_21175 [Sphingobium cupriresistens]|uniref:Uncharacterized protein n=1 Tax=Sphingobium cupriresistens TaxID=1132417 RepID=A0A8G1ZDZ8_9SPHN|nr:hypothetical protein EWH12_21175 [Sphingobium cupriresistens]
MRTREKLADVVAGQPGRLQRKQFVRSLKETAGRAVVTASVTFAVGWVLKRMFENSVADAAKEGAAEGAQQDIVEENTGVAKQCPAPVAGVTDEGTT